MGSLLGTYQLSSYPVHLSIGLNLTNTLENEWIAVMHSCHEGVFCSKRFIPLVLKHFVVLIVCSN